MQVVFWLVAAVLMIVAVSALAERMGTLAPLVLMFVGLAASLLPFVPEFELRPEVVLLGILPPLLYSAAYNTSFIDFKDKIGSIASLSVGLVIVTAVVVGGIVSWIIPGVPLAAGIALGAVVAPPDAVAATAVARRVGMPTDVVQILEGESLVNDATALTLLRSALIAVGGAVTFWQVGLGFLLAAGGGVAVGIVVALIYTPIRRRIETPSFDTALSFAIPYVAFLPAEAMHASGVVAVVTAGLIVGHRAPSVQSGVARLTTEANWRTVAFLLENGVFLIIGLQLTSLISALDDDPDVSLTTVAVAAVAVYATTVITRFAWVFGAGAVPGLWQRTVTSVRERTVISWAGMRGVVTLAAALTIPETVADRDVLVFVAFVVVIASLIVQGGSLPWLVRRLHLAPPDPAQLALSEAALLDRISTAGLARLDELTEGQNTPAEVVARLRARSEDRNNTAWERVSEPGSQATPTEIYVRLRTDMLATERRAALTARDGGHYPDEVVRSVVRLLDVEESMLDRLRTPGSERTGELVVEDRIAATCEHLTAAPERDRPADPVQCAACVADGTEWVHLRLCVTCGEVGCCDSSPGRHATTHFEATGHPVMRSVEPGEAWRWCYVDEVLGN